MVKEHKSPPFALPLFRVDTIKEKTMSVRCPKCKSERFYYKQTVVEYHTIDKITESGVELMELSETYPVAETTELVCDACDWSGGVAEYRRLMAKKGKVS